MDNAQTELTPSEQGTVDAEDQVTTGAALATAVGSVIRQREDRLTGELARAIGELAAPQAPRVSVTPDADGPAPVEPSGGRVRTSDPTEYMYARMSSDMRAVRSPELDHYCTEWLRGLGERDRPRMLHAEAKLNELSRAPLLQGAAGAGGALSAGTGGALIPRPLEQMVLVARDRVAKMRRYAFIYQMTAQQHTVPKGNAMTSGMVGENGPISDATPTSDSFSLVARKGAAAASASNEMINDSAINVVNFFVTRAGGALGVLEDDQFFKDGGAGGNAISARLTGTAFSLGTGNQVTNLSHDNVVGMYYGVPQAYRIGAMWFASTNVLQLLTAVKDNQGRPLYQGLQERPLPMGDDPATVVGTLLGRAVVEAPFADGTLWFGDPQSTYCVGSREGITVARSDEYAFLNDAVTWRFTQRFDGNTRDDTTNAARIATGITSASSAPVSPT